MVRAIIIEDICYYILTKFSELEELEETKKKTTKCGLFGKDNSRVPLLSTHVKVNFYFSLLVLVLSVIIAGNREGHGSRS
jgi:hypothetical protein